MFHEVNLAPCYQNIDTSLRCCWKMWRVGYVTLSDWCRAAAMKRVVQLWDPCTLEPLQLVH